MHSDLADAVAEFLGHAQPGVERIWNEHGLQLELGIFLRGRGWRVEFERPFRGIVLPTSTKTVKRELDILATRNGEKTAIELKTPLAGRVPETMYDFCADIEFVESLIRADIANSGLCVLVTSDNLFWQGSTRDIYRYFRDAAAMVTGCITKPTGTKDTQVTLTGSYFLGGAWAEVGNLGLLPNAKYLLARVK